MIKKCLTFVLFALLSLSGCDSGTSAGAFLATLFRDPPAPAPITLTILADPSLGSPCGVVELTGNIDAALAAAAPRPRSTVAVWVMGADLVSTRELARVSAPEASSRGDRARQAAQRTWIEASRAELLSASRSVFADRPRSSPLAEALTAVAFARHGPNPTIALVTDGLQVSAATYDFECSRKLPEPAQFVSRLNKLALLTPGSLSGTNVVFANDRITSVDRCALTMSRVATVRNLWSAAIRNAGGTVSFTTDAATTKELGGVQ